MGAFDRFYDKEKLIRKTIEIENELYDKLNEISKNKYNTSTNMLINASIDELIKTEDIKIYEREEKYCSSMKHSLLIRESFTKGLEKLKQKYNISVSKLVNIAIRNAINELD